MSAPERPTFKIKNISLSETAGVGELEISSDASILKLVWQEDWNTGATTEIFTLDKVTGVVTVSGHPEEEGPAILDRILSYLEEKNKEDRWIDGAKAIKRCLGLKLEKMSAESASL